MNIVIATGYLYKEDLFKNKISFYFNLYEMLKSASEI